MRLPRLPLRLPACPPSTLPTTLPLTLPCPVPPSASLPHTAWESRLSEEEIQGVAAYVFKQAEGNLW